MKFYDETMPMSVPKYVTGLNSVEINNLPT